MTLARRLTRLEIALPPTEAVLLWLEDAQVHRSLTGHACWLMDHPEQVHPLARINDQVAASTRAVLRGEDHDVAAAAVRKAIGHATFLFALVLRIEVATDDLVRIEGPRIAALGEWRLNAGRRPRRWQALAADTWRTLDDHDRTRRWLEAEHLDGRQAMFADTAVAWTALVDQARGLAGEIPAMASNEGRPPGVTDLTAAARADALDLVGQTLVAASIAGRRARGLE